MWVLADSNTGCTYKLSIYSGEPLIKPFMDWDIYIYIYDVITEFMQGLFKQGYHLYCDNLYSS